MASLILWKDARRPTLRIRVSTISVAVFFANIYSKMDIVVESTKRSCVGKCAWLEVITFFLWFCAFCRIKNARKDTFPGSQMVSRSLRWSCFRKNEPPFVIGTNMLYRTATRRKWPTYLSRNFLGQSKWSSQAEPNTLVLKSKQRFFKILQKVITQIFCVRRTLVCWWFNINSQT